MKSGLPCGTCARSFARPAPVNYLPPGMQVVGSPYVLPAGDPRLGGILCYKCHGDGWVYDFLDTRNCPACRGVGRLR